MALRISEQGGVITILSGNLELVERFKEIRTKHTLPGKLEIQFSNRVLHKLQKILEKVTRKVKNPFLDGILKKRVLVLTDPWALPNQSDHSYKKLWLIQGYFQDVQLIESLSAKSKNFLHDFLQPDRNSIHNSDSEENQVGIHMRRGDYRGIPEYGILADCYFLKVLEHFRGRNPIVLLASDEEIDLNNLKLNLRVKLLRASDHNPLNTINRLGSTSAFIMSNSTFSFWVGWLVMRNGGHVFAPSPWFQSAKTPKDYLYLKEFEKIESIFE